MRRAFLHSTRLPFVFMGSKIEKCFISSGPKLEQGAEAAGPDEEVQPPVFGRAGQESRQRNCSASNFKTHTEMRN